MVMMRASDRALADFAARMAIRDSDPTRLAHDVCTTCETNYAPWNRYDEHNGPFGTCAECAALESEDY